MTSSEALKHQQWDMVTFTEVTGGGIFKRMAWRTYRSSDTQIDYTKIFKIRTNEIYYWGATEAWFLSVHERIE